VSRIQPKAPQSQEHNAKVAAAKTMASNPAAGDLAREAALKDAANTKAKLERRLTERALLFWAIATALGALLAGVLGLELLRSVGVASAPVWLEILSPGLRSVAAPSNCTT
jgi:ferric-dicitrate binding protein FerR (iron transport regulator)